MPADSHWPAFAGQDCNQKKAGTKSSVGILLQKDNLESSQKETAVAIVQKIQGTELFSLPENSMEGASRKIAELLDSSLSTETHAGSSILRRNDLEGFDIGAFV